MMYILYVLIALKSSDIGKSDQKLSQNITKSNLTKPTVTCLKPTNYTCNLNIQPKPTIYTYNLHLHLQPTKGGSSLVSWGGQTGFGGGGKQARIQGGQWGHAPPPKATDF